MSFLIHGAHYTYSALDNPSKHKTFLDRLQLKNPNFDILELAHLGALITKKTGSKLDWFDSDVKSVEINKHFGL